MESWPDHLTPTDSSELQYLLDFTEKGKLLGPVIVHCSAGNGRTGTFIAIYNIIQCLKTLKSINQEIQKSIEPFFSVFNIVRKMREQRIGMISSAEQYKFVYEYCSSIACSMFCNNEK